VKSRPRGRRGGADGTSGKVETASGAKFRAMGLQTVPADERLSLSLPGGAGWGDPLERPPARVAADVADGLVARDAAERDYGVVLTEVGVVDEAATAKLRARRRATAA
jgi:N-methylhydantoinase B